MPDPEIPLTTRTNSSPRILEGEFWPARQRAGHPLHEISYRACFKPQLPTYFIEEFSQAGDLVYDPFMGRGTTLIEAALRGRRCAGNDANPLSAILTAPRLAPPSIEAICSRIDSVELSLPSISQQNEDLLAFFHPSTLAELLAWRQYFHQRESHGNYDIIDAWIRMVATNRLTVRWQASAEVV